MTRRPTPATEADPLTAAPEYAAWVAEGAELAARQDALAQQIASAQRAQVKADEDHAGAVRDAVRSGAAIPEPPVPPDLRHLDAASAVQRSDEQSHRDRRSTVVSGVADQVSASLRGREQDRMEQLVAIGAKLDQIEAEARQDAALVTDLFECQDRDVHTRPSRSSRVVRPDVPTLLAAARQGKSLLDPAALPAPNLESHGFVQVDTSHPWQRPIQQPDLHGLER